ncbi:MAG: DUF2167 domain-containing protein [Gemmatimonadota bacterium]
MLGVRVGIRAGGNLLASAAVFISLLASPLVAQDDVEEIPWILGPTTVTLGKDVAQLEVGEAYLFADGDLTRQLLEWMGNPTGDTEVGLLAPADSLQNWFIIFEYFPVGYVKDDEADEIVPATLLKSIREGTEAANEMRKEMGAPAIHVVGWSQEPHYDPATHNLVWAILGRDDEGNEVVNYNVRLLGRGGYMSVTLVDEPKLIAQSMPQVEGVMAGFTFQRGKTYAEWVPGDKVAPYGIAALVTGVAATKLGLFAVLGKFLGKAWKLVVAGVAAVGLAIKKAWRAIFGGKERGLAQY